MEVTRTLVKSPPELWAELSDVASLARHLGEFGTIRIVRTEPESVVEWEADRASGSVRLEPAGWGTRVTLTAEPVAAEPAPAAPEPEPEPEAAEPAPAEPLADSSPAPEPPPSEPVSIRTEAQASPPRRRGIFARLFRRREREAPQVAVAAPAVEAPAAVEAPPSPAPPPALEPPPDPPDVRAEERPPPEPAAPPLDEAEVLAQALHALGAAHHRPFSR